MKTQVALRDRVWQVGTRLALIVVGTVLFGFILFPLYYLVISSLQPADRIFASPPPLLPWNLSLHFYAIAATEAPILLWTSNSLIVVAGTVALAMPLAVLSAYGITRFDFAGRGLVSRFILVLYMFPSVLLLVPLFVLLARLNLVNSIAGLILAHTTFALPFSVWYLSAYMRGVPRELDDAALVDGCNRLNLLWRVLLPVMAPGIAATTAFVFMFSWNEYAFAVTLIQNAELRTLPLGVASYLSVQGISWGVVLATSILMSLPVGAVVLLAQRYFVSGLAAGSVKG
jgi:ABC-type glycerol-3-phosphate transport system permease component